MIEYKGYLGHVKFDDEADLFYGEIVNTRDVITFQGKSVSEIHQAFKDSIDDYLDFCVERGEKPNHPFTGRITLCLSPDQHRKVVMAADDAGKEIDSWLVDVIENAITFNRPLYAR